MAGRVVSYSNLLFACISDGNEILPTHTPQTQAIMYKDNYNYFLNYNFFSLNFILLVFMEGKKQFSKSFSFCLPFG